MLARLLCASLALGGPAAAAPVVRAPVKGVGVKPVVSGAAGAALVPRAALTAPSYRLSLPAALPRAASTLLAPAAESRPAAVPAAVPVSVAPAAAASARPGAREIGPRARIPAAERGSSGLKVAAPAELAARELRGALSGGRTLGARDSLDTLFDDLRFIPASVPIPAAEPSGAAPRGAPAEAEGKSGAELLRALRHAVNRQARSLGYKEARRFIFSTADNIVFHGERGILELYSQLFIPGTGGDGTRYKERGDENGDGFVDSQGMNIEHIWPQSYFSQRSPMVSDLHHLLPSFMHPNSVRSRYPYGEVPDGQAVYRTRAGAKLGDGVFEPPDGAKGRVARALLYFYIRYHDREILPRGLADRFWNRHLETLLRWNRQFPPDAHERARNDLVESVQNNRNPLIDDPSLADRIGLDALRMSGDGRVASFDTPEARRLASERTQRKHEERRHKHKRRHGRH